MQDNKQSKDLKDHRKIKIGIIVSLVVIALIVGIFIAGGEITLQKNNGEVTKGDQKKVDIPIDFATLQAQNSDIYAWIRIPDTKIDYPIAQHPTDDSFYLNNDLNKEPSASGMLYTELLNRKDFADPNTIIYGHNMKDEARIMFGSLLDYENQDFFKTHRDFVIYTPDKILKYKVFTAYETDDRHILYSYDFHSPTVYKQYLDELLKSTEPGRIVMKDVKVNSDHQIVTLSTCVNGHRPERRFIVQAVRTE
ncbi:MAG: class B sortase [Eubacterium sp.]